MTSESQPKSEARIEDYAMIGDFKTAALVSRDGSIDWLCLPRFDSGACFARLLGSADNGFWRLSPKGVYKTRRRYRENTLILETDFECDEGKVRLIDCMLMESEYPKILRIVRGLSGSVSMAMELVIRFDYGSVVPWVTKSPYGGLKAVAGTDTVRLKSTVETFGKDMRTYSHFTVAEGESIPFLFTWSPSHHSTGLEVDDPDGAVERLAIWWQDWLRACRYEGPYKETVHRSLITLKALTFQQTGGVLAAATTSLPEEIGGSRNWDYRYCWLRDSSLTLHALIQSGYREEALAWRDWLHRAVAGTPEQIKIMYGIGGERRLPEVEIPWLQGYEGSRPVRIGNAAAEQFQLDIYGGLLDAFLLGHMHGLHHQAVAWRVHKSIVEFLADHWREPDKGIWEVRGPARHFTFSKVMCWVAFDRAARLVLEMKFEGDGALWAKIAGEIREDVMKNGFDAELGCFVQSYGAKNLDASLLMLPATGFIDAKDPRMIMTTQRIVERLMRDGLVQRYLREETDDGLSGQEGAFLACTLWLVDNLVLQGRREEAEALFHKVLGLQNDVGLYSEEYDAEGGRFLGNFPQAFTHVAIINTAFRMAESLKAEPRVERRFAEHNSPG